MAIGREIVQRGRCQQYCLETLCDVLLRHRKVFAYGKRQ